MNHYGTEIRHHPLAGRESVDGKRTNAVFGSEPFLEFACDGFEVRVGCARTDHKKVGEIGYAAQIQYGDVLRFFIGGDMGNSEGERF